MSKDVFPSAKAILKYKTLVSKTHFLLATISGIQNLSYAWFV
jgi:hypothetical protein